VFWVWSTTGVQTPYAPGAPERRRRVERARAPEAVESPDALPSDLPGRSAAHGPHADAIALYQHGEREHERRRAVTAAQLMVAPVLTLGPDATLAEAWDIVRRHGFRHVPIVDAGGALIGMLSDRDLLRHALEPRTSDAAATRVRQIMATRVLTARPEAGIRQVARILFEERIGAMPIVDEQGTPVGIVTRSDVLRAVLTSGPLELWI
jgi:acetoin utilization protein AcuB